ncbi:MAG: aminotransferase class IV, partial [Vulcanococcus sp.]
GAVANLLVRRHGRWLTPPLSSGCLAGVMRARALELGLAEEAELRWEELALPAGSRAEETAWNTGGSCAKPAPEAPGGASHDHWVLLNSLGCRPLRAVNGQPLPHLSASEAEAFWRQLLGADPQAKTLSCNPAQKCDR